MLLSLSRLLLLFISVQLTTACGAGTSTVEIHEYSMAVLGNDQEVKWEFQKLIAEFNAFAGLEVIEYVDNANQANSVVFLTKNLKVDSPENNKIGYGQWLAEIQEEQWYSKPGQERQRVVRYAMKIELDDDYIRSRMTTETTISKKEKQVLFFHEIGHGLEMDHHEDRVDIMYKDVAANRDFDSYFERVRQYMTK
jgi:hypothetical protein